jgi:hypothetical protein
MLSKSEPPAWRGGQTAEELPDIYRARLFAEPVFAMFTNNAQGVP